MRPPRRRQPREPEPLSPERAAELAAVAAGMEFVFGKTMPDQPHEYTVRSEANHTAFDELRAAIRRHGVTGYWRGRRNRYLQLGDGFKYWLTPPSPVINRDAEPIELSRKNSLASRAED